MGKKCDESEAKSRHYLQETLRRAIEQRSKEQEFHGLNREFIYHQANMINQFNISKDIKHPRDIGAARESILRNFLKNSGYLAPKYGVSETSSRVVSSNGHISKEIDIVIYDAQNVTTLMKRNDSYDVFPIECVHGVIQVKSTLNKDEIMNGLENLASFKKLCDGVFSGNPEDRKFALLFSYASNLAWIDSIKEVEKFARCHLNTLWANAIFILNEGYFLHGASNAGFALGHLIENIRDLKMFGVPDREGLCLYTFISILDDLISRSATVKAAMNDYFSLPLIAEELSYRFSHGQFAEVAQCHRHGDYARKISAKSLRKIVDFCSKAEPINWIKANDIAYGRAGDNNEAYLRQPGDVRIYNPDNLSLADILLMDSEFQGKK